MNCRFPLGSQNDEKSCVRKGAEKMVDKVAGIGRKLGIYDLVEFTPKI
jgi:L-ribulose-5-phosphate 3-epimerase UlaE